MTIRIIGTPYNDTLYGTDMTDDAEEIYGLEGNDNIYTRDGSEDTVHGGDGEDLIVGEANLNYLYGDAGNDTIVVNGINHAYGGSGIGGNGNDIITIAADIEGGGNGGAGNDLIRISAESVGASGGAGNDRIEVNGSETYVHGDDGNDRIISHDGFWSSLDGGAGNDTIFIHSSPEYPGASYDPVDHTAVGGAGNDTITAYVMGARINGDDGNDTLTGSDDATLGADYLYGLAGNDVIVGRAGNDKIGGGTGLDRMTGGTGNDQFDVRLNDTGVGLGKRDIITDFQHGADDILLARIDANVGKVGDQAFTFIGVKAFTGAGQLRFFHEGDHTVIQASTDADRAAEFELQLSGKIALTAIDFVL